jgi:hypothetical protein
MEYITRSIPRGNNLFLVVLLVVGALFTLPSCGGGGGSSTASPPPTPSPTVNISVNPTTVTVGQSTTLTWSSTNASSCKASGAWSGAEATSGSQKVTPSTSGTATYSLNCTGSGGAATGSAQLTVNQKLSISGVSNSSPLPLTPIQVTTTGLNASAPLTIQFSDSTGYSASETPIRIASDGSTVIVAVPLYISIATQQIGPGTVSLTLSQGNMTTNAVMVNIQDLPPVSSYGVQPGQITHAFLQMEATLVGRRLNEFQAFQVANGNTVDTSSAQSDLSSVLTSTIEARSDVDRVTLNNTVAIPAGTLPDGNSIQFDETTLDLMDRIHGIFLTGPFGAIVNQLSTAGVVKKRRMVHVRSRTGRFAVRVSISGIASSAHFSSLNNGRNSHRRSGVPPLNWAGILQAMEGVNNITDLTEATQKGVNAQGIADAVSAIGTGAGAVNSILVDNFKFGVVATFVSTLNVSAHCWGDVLYWAYAEATGDQALAASAVQDMQSIPLSEELRAIQNLALAPFEALQGASTVLNFVENMASYASQDSNGNSEAGNDLQTDLMILTSDGTVASSPSNGLAEIQGVVDLTSNLGIEQPQSSIDLSPGPGGETIASMADPNGNYDLLVPLGVSGFDYSSAQLDLVDPISDNALGSELIDLTGATTTAALQVPTMDGTCNDTDINDPDGDDPDCD